MGPSLSKKILHLMEVRTKGVGIIIDGRGPGTLESLHQYEEDVSLVPFIGGK